MNKHQLHIIEKTKKFFKKRMMKAMLYKEEKVKSNTIVVKDTKTFLSMENKGKLSKKNHFKM